MSAPGFWEWAFLAMLALMIFGPDQLPKLARSAGQVIGKLKREASSTLDELKQASDFEEFSNIVRELRGTTDELRRSTRLSGPIASDARPVKPKSASMPTVTAKAPFDPDAP